MSVITIVIVVTLIGLCVPMLLNESEACSTGCMGIAGLILAFSAGAVAIFFLVLGGSCTSMAFH